MSVRCRFPAFSAASKDRYDAAMERTTLHIACALAVACTAPGCITYVSTKKDASYSDLGIASAIGALEIGAGLLGGYIASNDDEPDELNPMISLPAGILFVDVLIALGLWAADD